MGSVIDINNSSTTAVIDIPKYDPWSQEISVITPIIKWIIIWKINRSQFLIIMVGIYYPIIVDSISTIIMDIINWLFNVAMENHHF